MDTKLPITEQLYPIENQIDSLDISEAFDLILNDQFTIFKLLKNRKKDLLSLVDYLVVHLSENKDSKLVYCGAGTSGRIAVQDCVELYPTFGWPKKRIDFIIAGGNKALLEPVEYSEDDIKMARRIFKEKKIKKEDIIFGLAASGNTSFTNEILIQASQIDAITVAISNNKYGKILKNAKFKIVLDTKQEVVAGSTRLKAGTAQKICLNLISTLIMTKLGRVKNGQMVNMVPTNKKLISRMNRIKNMKWEK